MAALLTALIDAVAVHPLWAYATVWLAALLEAVPVLGSFIPGSTLIFGIGALAAVSQLSLPWLLASAALGAALGDGSAFWVGHIRQREILAIWPLSAYPEVVERSEAFFQHHGTLAVFFARFVAPVRAFVPVTAGALGMPPHHFFAINLAAIAIWAPAHILPAALAGSASQQWSSDLKAWEQPILLALAAAAAAALAIWAIVRRRRA